MVDDAVGGGAYRILVGSARKRSNDLLVTWIAVAGFPPVTITW